MAGRISSASAASVSRMRTIGGDSRGATLPTTCRCIAGTDEFLADPWSYGHDLHRSLPLGRPLRAVRRHADDRSRRHDRERGTPLDPGRPGLFSQQPGLGGQRLPDRVRRPAAARRTRRRSDRAAAHLPRRPRDLHRRFTAVRAGADAGDADHRALHPGRRRRADLRRDPRHDRDDVPRAARAGQGPRRVRVRRLRRRLARPVRRRRADRRHQLALDLLHQPADRPRHRPARAAADRLQAGPRAREGRGPARRRAADRRPDARRLHDPRRHRARLDVGPHRRARRHRRRAAHRLRRAPGPDRQPADAAAPVPLAQRHRREHRDGAARRRHVRPVLPGRAVPAADPRLQPVPGRPRVPAVDAS